MKLDLPKGSDFLYEEYRKQDNFVLQNIKKENIPKAKDMIVDFDFMHRLNKVIKDNKDDSKSLSKGIQIYFQEREAYLKGIQKKFS